MTAKKKMRQIATSIPMTSLTVDQVEHILHAVATGSPVRQAALAVGTTDTGFYRLMAYDPDIALRYTHARDAQADHYFDEIIGIADDSSLAPDDRRVRIYARQWVACRMRPNKYGERVSTRITPNGDAASSVTVNIIRHGDAPLIEAGRSLDDGEVTEIDT